MIRRTLQWLRQRTLAQLLIGLFLVAAIVILAPRDQLLIFDVSSEVLTFTTADNVTTKFWIGAGTMAPNPGASERRVDGTLISVESGVHASVRKASDSVVIVLRRPGGVGTLGDSERLPETVWLRLSPSADENLIVPFVGGFTIGEVVGPTTAAILVDGTVDVIEKVLIGDLTYVNRSLDLLRGDRLEVEAAVAGESDIQSRGFVHVQWTSDAGALTFRGQAAPGRATLVRTQQRPALRLAGSLWGRLREGADIGYLLLAISTLAALVEIMKFFSERSRVSRPSEVVAHAVTAPSPAAAAAPTAPVPQAVIASDQVQAAAPPPAGIQAAGEVVPVMKEETAIAITPHQSS